VESLTDVWSRRRALALLCFLAAATPGVTLVLSLPDIFRSAATVLVEPQGPESPFALETDARLETINAEILSRARLLDLIQRHGLYADLIGRVPTEAVLEKMRRDIRTELKAVDQAGGRRGTVSFTLSYRGKDPQKVASVTNALAAFYLEEDVKIRERQATGTVQVLKGQLDEAKKRLEEQERRLASFQDRNLGELPQQTDVHLATLERLSDQLRVASDERIRAAERREAMLRRMQETPKEPSGDPDAAAARLSQLGGELEKLRRRYSDKHPDVIRMKEEIASLEQQLSEARRAGAAEERAAAPAGRAPSGARDPLRDVNEELAAARAEQERLRGQIAAYSRKLEAAPRRQLAFQEVWRDYQTHKDLYNTVLKKYEEARVAGGIEAESALARFRILDVAVPARDPVAPPRMRLLLMVLLMAAGGAALAVVARERLDTSFHGVDELRAFTRVPVLASIPDIVTTADTRRRGVRFCAAGAAVLLALGLAAAASHHVAAGNESLVSMLGRGRS
jgi:polysaccharide chain length determinant protein (PEP-CTERM system associated)